MDGFTHEDDAMQAPSVRNRLGASHAWLLPFKTDVLGSRPMRAVPISWIVRPGALSWTYGRMSVAPAAESISAAATDMALSRARSLSLHAQWILRAGMPQASVFAGSSSMWFSGRGRHSPKP